MIRTSFLLTETNNSEKNVKLLEISVDNNLSFEDHLFTLCKKASNQLNKMCRIKQCMGFKKKEIYFVYSDFNCCPLVWHFCYIQVSEKKKNNNLTLLNKHNKVIMEVKCLRNLTHEVFLKLFIICTRNTWKKSYISQKTLLKHRPLNWQVNRNGTIKYGI